MTTKESKPSDVAGFVDDWQKGKSLSESLLYSLKENVMCDVTFVVGETRKRISAHRLILSVRSCVFLSMLTGLLSSQDDIVIPDIDADIFEDILQFLYTDDVKIDGNNVIGLLYGANKYGIESLEKKCLAYLESSMTSQASCHVMEQAHFYHKPELKEKALRYIWENGDECLRSAGFSNLCHDCFVKVIESGELDVDEVSVFQASVNWSDAECRRQGRELTPHNRRSVLGDAVVEIRYPLIDKTYFDENVLPTVAFTESEELKIMKCFLFPEKDVSPFKSKCRQNRKKKTSVLINRFGRGVRQKLKHSCTCDEGIMICINEDAKLQGFLIYTSDKPMHYDIIASICDVITDEIVAGSSLSKSVDVDSIVYDVYFPSPVQLIKDRKYNLIVRIKGRTDYDGRCGLSVTHHGSFTCSFSDYKKCKHSGKVNNSDVNRGQLPGLIFLL